MTPLSIAIRTALTLELVAFVIGFALSCPLAGTEARHTLGWTIIACALVPLVLGGIGAALWVIWSSAQ